MAFKIRRKRNSNNGDLAGANDVILKKKQVYNLNGTFSQGTGP